MRNLSTFSLFIIFEILLQPLQMHPRRLDVVKSITILPMRERQIAREPGAGGDAIATDDKADGEFYVFEHSNQFWLNCCKSFFNEINIFAIKLAKNGVAVVLHCYLRRGSTSAKWVNNRAAPWASSKDARFN